MLFELLNTTQILPATSIALLEHPCEELHYTGHYLMLITDVRQNIATAFLLLSYIETVLLDYLLTDRGSCGYGLVPILCDHFALNHRGTLHTAVDGLPIAKFTPAYTLCSTSIKLPATDKVTCDNQLSSIDASLQK